VHGLSVTIGHFLGLTLPERAIAFVAAGAFLLFAVWTWRERRGGDDDDIRVAEPRFVIPAIISSFVLAELGDKTMLATVALASDRNPWGVWIGATIGMVLADGVAVLVGAMLHKKLPEGLLHGLASVLFLLVGLWMLFDAALGWRAVALAATLGTALCIAAVAAVRFRRARRTSAPQTPDRDSSSESV
jgi:putative Ca2+/H+ antiporter (TMEM165/GDT1 family)